MALRRVRVDADFLQESFNGVRSIPRFGDYRVHIVHCLSGPFVNPPYGEAFDARVQTQEQECGACSGNRNGQQEPLSFGLGLKNTNAGKGN
jgi:hypothetical protein